MRRSGFILTALLLGACSGGKNDTEAATEPSTSGGDTGPASESASSTDGGSEPTTTGSPTTPATDGASGSTSDGETSTGAGELPEATTCQKYCVMLAKCVGLTPEEAATCPEDCEAELTELESECRDAATATMACQAGLTCQQLDDLEQGEVGPCTDEAIAQEDVCGFGNACTIGGGGHGDGSMCEWSRECAGEPTLTMRCTEAACVCFEDEVEFGECAPESVCDDPDLLAAKALSCCGIGA